MPNGRSILGAGIWGPEKDQLALMRASILRSSKPLRDILSAPDFVAEFGEAKPFPPTPKGRKPKKKAAKGKKGKKGKKGDDDSEESDAEESEAEETQTPERRQRRSVFGGEDALKVAPKGIAKDHPDIDLLKCRSLAVVKTFSDEEVLKKGWQDEVVRVVRVVQPFVRLLNEMVTIPDEDGSDEE